jgi:hypothetical protein
MMEFLREGPDQQLEHDNIFTVWTNEINLQHQLRDSLN